MTPRPLAIAFVWLSILAALGAGCAGSVEDRLAEVRALQDAGQFNESIEPLRAVLARDPEQAEANYLLGVALVQTGQTSLAVWPLEKAAAAPGQSVQAGLLLATTFLGLEAYDDAIRSANQVLQAEPERVAALKIRAQALLGTNKREEALADTRRLHELAPDDFQATLMHATILAELDKMDEAEKAHADLEQAAEKSGDPGIAARGCLARASFFEDNLKDEKRAEAHYRHCLGKAPSDPFVLQLVTQFFDERGRREEATAIWNQALTDTPENLSFRVALASRHEAAGKVDDARKLLTDGVEQLGSPSAWNALSEFERRTGRPDAAFEAIEQAIQTAPGRSEQLEFAKGDLLVDLNRLDEADKLADTLQEPSFRDLLRGRVLLARGEAQAALASFEAGLKRWPNNAGGRYLAGLAARGVGDYDRAASEFREAVRADKAATDAALLLASLELSRGNPKDAAEFARNFITNRGGSRPEGYLVLIEATSAQGLHDAARRAADQLAGAGFAAQAAVARAGIEASAKGPEAAIKSVRASGLDLAAPENQALLRTFAEQLIALGRGEEALTAVDRALAAHGDQASLHELRGVVLMRTQRDGEASAEFERALALDPKQARAKTGLAEVAYRAGDAQRAIALYDEAAQIDPLNVAPAYTAAQLVMASGDRVGAKQRFEEIIRKDPGHAASRNDLAWMLAQSGEDLDRALALAQHAHRIDANPDIADTLGWVHLQRNELDRAVESFEQALAARPDSPSIRYHLALALARQGENQRALEALRLALGAGPFPEADAARTELARLEQK